MTRASLMALILVAGCGSSVLVPGGEGGDGASSSSSGSGTCVPCFNVYGSAFLADRLCPGEERAKYDALIACACQENTCGGPHDGCVDPNWDLLLCDGGYVDGPCPVPTSEQSER